MMIELTIILIVVVCTAWVFIAWVVWTGREFKQALKEAGFDEASGINGLALYGAAAIEERRRVEDQARAAATNR
jgi:hypothetical protein